MKDEIKERIEAVRRGEIPEGYTVEAHQIHPKDWKYDKIGKHLVAYDEYSNDTERYTLATSSRKGLLPQTEYYDDQRFEETSGGFHIVPEGYVTYRHMSDDDIFKFNVNDLGTPVLVSPEYPVFTTDEELNQDLLIEFLNSAPEFRTFCRAQKKGSTRTRMYFSRLGDFMMPIPPAAEQTRMAAILSACDQIIELKRKAVEDLQSLKKTCLAQMFPRKGDNVPELRFPGFTGPWEQHSLSELCVFEKGKGLGRGDLTNDGSRPCVLYGQLFTDYGMFIDVVKSYTDSDDIDVKLSEPGDLLIPRCSTAPEGIGRASSISLAGVILGFDINILKIKRREALIPDFASIAINHHQKELQSKVVGTMVRHLENKEVQGVCIEYPTSVEEQRTIVQFFRKIEDLITLHQRELEEQQNKKKALMQLLLTGLVRVKA